jgi:hypothetical protein
MRISGFFSLGEWGVSNTKSCIIVQKQITAPSVRAAVSACTVDDLFIIFRAARVYIVPNAEAGITAWINYTQGVQAGMDPKAAGKVLRRKILIAPP